jgi:hypothetical protein
LDESTGGSTHELKGRFVSLFDSNLRALRSVSFTPGSRWLLLDLDTAQRNKSPVLASASRAVVKRQNRNSVLLKIDGVDQTESIVLINSKRAPRAVTLEGQNLSSFEHNSEEKLLWVRFPNKPTPRYLEIQW